MAGQSALRQARPQRSDLILHWSVQTRGRAIDLDLAGAAQRSFGRVEACQGADFDTVIQLVDMRHYHPDTARTCPAAYRLWLRRTVYP